MNVRRLAAALALLAAAAVPATQRSMTVSAQSAAAAAIAAEPKFEGGPKYEVDPSWPKPLPYRWATGELGGVCVDKNDHVFILSRPNLYDGLTAIVKSAPPVMEFDPAGNLVNSWGDRATMADLLHGCTIDHEGHFWTAGNAEGFVQKYTRDGKLLLQVGEKGKVDSADGTPRSKYLNASQRSFFSPTEVAVDPSNGDFYVADGYGNKRVVAFDKTGKFLRQWGTQGTTADAAAGVGGVFVNIVHCITLGNDGLLYVCDRNGDRIQVFDKMGNFKRNIPIPMAFRAPYTGNGSVGSVTFSPDREQQYIFIGDFSDKIVRVFERASGKEVGRIGHPASHQLGGISSPHGVAVDSKGNVYVAEALDGRRFQRFKPVAAR